LGYSKKRKKGVIEMGRNFRNEYEQSLMDEGKLRCAYMDRPCDTTCVAYWGHTDGKTISLCARLDNDYEKAWEAAMHRAKMEE
jgi:hypothetical protein